MTESLSDNSNSPILLTEKADLCLLGENPIETWYSALVRASMIKQDEVQQEVVKKLQLLSKNLCEYETEKNGLLSFWGKAKKISVKKKSGLYLFGGVGVGKTFLMDAFYLQTAVERKIRVHFHAFMQRLHVDMKSLDQEEDPLRMVATRIAEKNKLICFDEFHVSDIVDAMILGRLLNILINSDVCLVMTSNYSPENLYPNGLARDRFLPAIALIKEHMDILALGERTDYRLRELKRASVYYYPLNEETSKAMNQIFDGLASGTELQPHFRVGGRILKAVRRTSDAIWFDFDILCGNNCSQSDYLVLANRFATIFLSEIPDLSSSSFSEESRRFTWLVDILYDAKINLVCSATVPLNKLYSSGKGGESGRTLSRLIEMQSEDYLSSVCL